MMDFAALPFNRTGVYIAAGDKYGCEVFIPCINERDAERVKPELQAFLDSQPDQEAEDGLA